jgi:uncharacterized protein DUF6967
MSDETVTALTEIDAPYGRKIVLESIQHTSDMRMLRLRIREGRRFTVLDIDADTALRWSTAMRAWASKAPV